MTILLLFHHHHHRTNKIQQQQGDVFVLLRQRILLLLVAQLLAVVLDPWQNLFSSSRNNSPVLFSVRRRRRGVASLFSSVHSFSIIPTHPSRSNTIRQRIPGRLSHPTTSSFLAMSATVSIPSTDVTNTTETNTNTNTNTNKNDLINEATTITAADTDTGSLVSLSSLSSVQLLPSSNVLPSSYSMNPIQRVAIVGGTHGNEYTGVWVVREWEEQQKIIKKRKNEDQQQQPDEDNTNNNNNQQFEQPVIDDRYPSLAITTLIGNPIAHVNNRRFMDVDLNRQFDLRTLQYDYELLEQHTQERTIPMEVQRAIEINELLGPKTRTPIPDTTGNDETYDQSSPSITGKDNMDLVIDLHSTTAAMECTLIIPEGDVLMIQAAAYVMYKCNQLYSASTSSDETATKTTATRRTYPIHFETRILIDHVRSCHSTRPFLPSIGKHEFTIEVGPVPQGVIRHDAIIKTKTALQYLLEFLEIYNTNHKTNNIESDPIQSILHGMYPTGIVPCYNDLGKLPWPTSPTNPNFPLWIIHESIQDQDYQVVRTGDPLFVTLYGDTIYYDGQYGNEVYLAFINEGGYYYASSGTGICLLQKTSVNYTTGILFNYTIPTVSSN